MLVKTNKETVLKERVVNKFKWDIRVSTADINVTYDAGQIILYGIVDSSHKKDAAIEIAMNTKGVSKVISQIEVTQNFERDDTQLKNLIEKKMQSIFKNETEAVQVEVSAGVVTLEGVLSTKEKKAQSSCMVWKLSGIKDLVNKIKIDDLKPPEASTFMANPLTVMQDKNYATLLASI